MARVYMNFGRFTPGRRMSDPAVIRAARFRRGEQSRRPHLCGPLLQQSGHELSRFGRPLSEVEREAESGLEFARKLRFGIVVDMIERPASVSSGRCRA